MSLIREALEKARRETPRRVQTEPRYPESPATAAGAGPWRTPRQARAWPWLVLVGLASLALGVTATRLWNRPLPAASAAVTPSEESAPALGAGPWASSPTLSPAPAAERAPVVETPPAPQPSARLPAPALPAPAEPTAAPVSTTPARATPSRTVRPAPAVPELRLDGIVSSATTPVAMINGRPVGIGELVEGYRILRISAQEVEVERDGVRAVLRLR